MIDPSFDPELRDAKVVQLAKLTGKSHHLYPAIDGAYWLGVLDRGATDYGVFLRCPGGPRFVSRHHLIFRDSPGA